MSDDAKSEITPDLFLSYAGGDRESIAKPLVRAIRRAGLSVWYDEIDSPLKKGDEHSPSAVARMLHDSIVRCKQAWLVIGLSYRERKWTKYEALSLSALSACGIADLGVIHHSIDDEELRNVLDDLRLEIDTESNNVIRYQDDPQAISAHLLSFVEPRVSLVMAKRRGPIDIAIFEQLGQVFLFANGGIGGDKAEIIPFDFCGHRIGKETNMEGLLGTFLDELPAEGQSMSAGDASAVATIQSTEAVTIGFLNHPNYDLFTAKEIELGVVQTLGESFLIPVVTWGPVTIAQITDDPPQIVRECVKTIENSGIDEWSRIHFSDDGTFRVA